jgi:hypothetical protein
VDSFQNAEKALEKHLNSPKEKKFSLEHFFPANGEGVNSLARLKIQRVSFHPLHAALLRCVETRRTKFFAHRRGPARHALGFGVFKTHPKPPTAPV